jgi:hypothetical protein
MQRLHSYGSVKSYLTSVRVGQALVVNASSSAQSAVTHYLRPMLYANAEHQVWTVHSLIYTMSRHQRRPQAALREHSAVAPLLLVEIPPSA